GDHRQPAEHWSKLSTLTGVWLWADVERIIVPLLRTPDPHRVGYARDDNRATVDPIYYALDQTSPDEEEGHHEDSESACIRVPVDDALPGRCRADAPKFRDCDTVEPFRSHQWRGRDPPCGPAPRTDAAER